MQEEDRELNRFTYSALHPSRIGFEFASVYVVSEASYHQHSGEVILSHAKNVLDCVLRRVRNDADHGYVFIVRQSMAIVKISGLVAIDLARCAEGLDGHPELGTFALLRQAKL